MKHTLITFIFIASIFFPPSISASQPPTSRDYDELGCNLFTLIPEKIVSGKRKREDDQESDIALAKKKAKIINFSRQDILGFLEDVLDAESILYYYAFESFIKPTLKKIDLAQQSIKYSQSATADLIPPTIAPIKHAMQPSTQAKLSISSAELHAISFYHTHACYQQIHLAQDIQTRTPAQICTKQNLKQYEQKKASKNNSMPAEKKIKTHLSLSLSAIIALLEEYAPNTIKSSTYRREDECFICNQYQYHPRENSKNIHQETCVRRHILATHREIIETALHRKNITL